MADAASPTAMRLWTGFVAMCVGMFMAILDVQIVATSLPAIQSALRLRPDEMVWIQTAYLTAEVVAIALTGVLTRALSMRGLFVAALSLFTLASLGCAASDGFASLIAWRVLQGFAGGALIPAVFAAVFLLFAPERQGIATAVAGVLAVLAPTVGPVVGGWITDTLSWRWLFLVNLLPGVVAVAAGARALPRAPIRVAVLRDLDVVALAAIALALAALQIALKEAPRLGWGSGPIALLLVIVLAAGTAFVRRSLARNAPVVELRLLADPRFALGCAMSFLFGAGLFGSVYLMPVFLAFVRQHEALEIGRIMLVTGAAQLATAPLATWLERRGSAMALSAFGFASFAVGLAMGGFHDRHSDWDEMFWPQVVRGVAIMFCLLPPTRIALGHLAPERLADASALFNLMRNLGGAVGLAAIDTILYGRAPVHAERLGQRLLAGDETAATLVGIPLVLYRERLGQPLDADARATVEALVERAGLIAAINEAWLMLAAASALGLVLLLATAAVLRRRGG